MIDVSYVCEVIFVVMSKFKFSDSKFLVCFFFIRGFSFIIVYSLIHVCCSMSKSLCRMYFMIAGVIVFTDHVSPRPERSNSPLFDLTGIVNCRLEALSLFIFVKGFGRINSVVLRKDQVQLAEVAVGLGQG